MRQRTDRLLQFSMSPTNMVRMSAFTLLISLVAGVATATAGHCRQQIPGKLIRDLWNQTNVLISKLPDDKSFPRWKRLLPKFCTKRPECSIDWLELREMIDVYQNSVFSTAVIQEVLPQHYDELLYRLHHMLQHCVSSSTPNTQQLKYLKAITKTERKIKKRRDEGALKAVREFSFILRWIEELI